MIGRRLTALSTALALAGQAHLVPVRHAGRNRDGELARAAHTALAAALPALVGDDVAFATAAIAGHHVHELAEHRLLHAPDLAPALALRADALALAAPILLVLSLGTEPLRAEVVTGPQPQAVEDRCVAEPPASVETWVEGLEAPWSLVHLPDGRALVSERFDFEEMARRSLALHWKGRTPEEQKEFVSLYTDLLESTYIKKIERYENEKILYLDEKIEGAHAQVKTAVVTSKEVEIPIVYRLIQRGKKWMVYDVVV